MTLQLLYPPTLSLVPSQKYIPTLQRGRFPGAIGLNKGRLIVGCVDVASAGVARGRSGGGGGGMCVREVTDVGGGVSPATPIARADFLAAVVHLVSPRSLLSLLRLRSWRNQPSEGLTT